MPSGSGRKGCPEWSEVIITSDNEQNKNKVECKYCKLEISAKIERIKVHLNKCEQRKIQQTTGTPTSTSVVQCSSDILGSDESETSTSFSDHSCPSTSRSVKNKLLYDLSNQSVVKRQMLMGDFTIKTTPQQKEVLDIKIAKFFYANNIAFNAASSFPYNDMIDALRPGYKGPSRSALAGPLLDIVSAEIDLQMQKQIADSSSCCTLLQDGWSNVKNDPIIATTVHTGSSSFLLSASDCESNKKTAEYCAQSAINSIKDCEERFGIKIIAVCTDNENKMEKMRKILESENADLLTYGCSAHYVNLIENEVTPQTVLKHIVEVQKFFRNHHQPHGWLKETDGAVPQLPNSTRWNSQLDCVDTFIKNYHKYVQIHSEHTDDIPNNIAKIIDNVQIYKESLNLIKQLKEVSRVLDLLQSDSTNLSHAVELWLDLVESSDLESYKEIILKRMNQALQPFHYLANIMDPKYRGRRLSASQEDEAEQWVMEKHPNYLPYILAFKIADAEYYPASIFSEDVVCMFQSAKWWNIVAVRTEKRNKLPKEFCSFISNLLSCPASSAAIERIFSTFGMVWSKLRNRLGIERATKLVKVYKHFHSSDTVRDS